ncbi:MAG: dihydropteroate synthase [Proteobacteria bacterium]|nr:dihydropteroate synthase [Pseudomonadota bacterium]
MSAVFRCGRFSLPLDFPLIMGVVNITPDSFSDGGQFLAADAAIAQANRLVAEGAAILDLGAESTRPGAAPVSEDEELARLLPVLEALRDLDVPVSIDTRRSGVMREVLAAGASMINDIEALSGPGSLEAASASDCGVCLMHKKGDPATMQLDPQYEDVVGEVSGFLAGRVAAARAAGIGPDRIVVDPGFGFGKTAAHNLELLRNLGRIAGLGSPVLAGLSRKSTLGALTGRPATGRLPASIAAALLAAQRGATILRVHDVAATRDALAVWRAVEVG